MNTRTRILDAAADLLAMSPDGDISTRAVCDAARISAPVLYRQFGDKRGLLAAVVDHGFDAYLTAKQARMPAADPVEDLRAGWDSHIAFALSNRNLYRLMNSPAMHTPPASALLCHQILTDDLERVAAQGALRVSPVLAAQMVMSANVGVALMLVSRPAHFSDPDLSARTRDAVHAAILTPEAIHRPAAAADAVPTGTHGVMSVRTDAGQDAGTPAAAARLGALLRRSRPAGLTTAEGALLDEWLKRLSDTPQRESLA